MATPILSEIFPIRGMASSMIGGRTENQDDWGYMDTPLGFLLVVCDGMGGGPGGKMASYIAKCEIMRVISSCSPQMSRKQAMQKAISIANETLELKVQEMPRMKGMGSTLVAILINKESALVTHLGDSRCYRVKRGKVTFRTNDHSLVGELVRNKTMSEEEARTSPQSNVIMRALGATNNHTPELEEVPFRKGDKFILCTDGVWGIMPREALEKRFTSYPDIPTMIANLDAEIDQIGMAQGGYHDNHTIAAIEILMNPVTANRMNKTFYMLAGGIMALLFASLSINVYLFCMKKEITKQLKKQQKKESLYNEILTNGNKDKNIRIQDLIHEKDSLTNILANAHTHIQQLSHEKDSLVNELEKLKSNLARLKTNEESTAPSGSETKNQKKMESDVLSPIDVLKEVTNILGKMQTATKNTQKELENYKSQLRKKILEKLNYFDQLTQMKFKAKTDDVRNKLKDGATAMYVDKKDKKTGKFHNTQKAKEALSGIKKIIENIEKELRNRI